MCDKSRNTWLCVHWQWNTLQWCQLNALQASPVVHLVTPLSCVSLSMNTQPSVPTIDCSGVGTEMNCSLALALKKSYRLKILTLANVTNIVCATGADQEIGVPVSLFHQLQSYFLYLIQIIHVKCHMCTQSTLLKLLPHFPGLNELMTIM